MTDTLFDLSPLADVDHEPEATIAERFAAFHAANPHVADVLEALADQWLLLHDRVGVKALTEQARWQSGLSTSGEPWRINNTYVSHYARLLIRRRPEWAQCIETRELRAA